MSVCATCPKELGARNKSGLCRGCLARKINSDPAVIKRRKAALDAYYADPVVRAGYSARITARNSNLTPEEREARRAHGRRQRALYLSRPDVVAKTCSPEVRARAGAGRTATVLSWCPPEMRAAYKDLTKRGKRAPVARAIILERVAKRQRMTMDAQAAADFMRRFSPVYRCDGTGRQQIGGTHWRYGSTTLDRDALIALALRKGWQPDSWKALAA